MRCSPRRPRIGSRSFAPWGVNLCVAFVLGGAITVGGTILPGATCVWAEELWVARARAVRAAMEQVAASVVTVELIGVTEPAEGEVAADAPTVAVAIDDERHFLASVLAVRGNPTSILLVTPSGRRGVATVVARDEARQIILLRSEEDLGGDEGEVKALRLWEGEATVGQTVIAVGRHAGSQSAAVSTGILSGTDRNWGLALQTDARVSSAFYGGPLVDLRGRVLGIIVPMVPDGGAENDTAWYDSGIAFAIPSAALVRRLPGLMRGEDVRRGLVGIVPKESDPYVESTEIAAVRPRSPAARADLQPGDVVRAIDSVEIRSHREIKQLLGGRDAGETVTLRIARGGEVSEKMVTLADSIPPLVPQRIGITVRQENVPPADAPTAGAPAAEAPQRVAPSEVVVSGTVAGLPADGKLQIGDRIRSLNGNPVDDVSALRRQVFSADPEQPLVLVISRDGQLSEVQLRSTAIAMTDPQSFPESLRYASPEDEKWEIREFAMPDIGNAAVLVAPVPTAAGLRAAAVDPRLGLAVLLADPGETDLKRAAETWLEPARTAGMIVCIVAPLAEDRWNPEEIDVPSRLAAAIRQNQDIDPARQVIGGMGSGAGGSLALAAAILRPGSFQGIAIRGDIRPPGIRLRENDPAAPLQLWLMPGEDVEPPKWSEAFPKLGFPVLSGQVDPAAILAWVRSLATL